MRYVDWVTVYPSSITLQTGHWYYGAWAEVCPPYADNTDVEWYSNNTYVASVNAVYGYIYANNPGTARIYARATDGSGASGYLTVTVRGNIYVSSVELNRTSMSLERGQSSTLTATVCPTNATNPAICWRSTNTAVATVSDGVVTARGTGTAYIYAEAADGNGAYDRCHVTVTGDILATSVRVRPASMTLTAGFSDYVHAEVCPEDTTDPNVEWYSSDESVATVNADSGLVVAQGAGTATITARVTDGSDVRGECLLTVNPPIPVTGIEVCPESLTMNVGEERDICYNICPGNATNQSVIWCSSNENVATVGLRSGRVYAHKAGTTTITATTADGGFAVSCVVKVVIESVTIKQDGMSNVVIFESSGKRWECVNRDTIFDEENKPGRYYTDRALYNYLTYYDKEDSLNSITTPREYTDDEIKLLYAIDPYGVADYVKRYADYLLGGLESALSYKDRIFKLLFDREPKYFARTLNGVWYETTDKSNLSAVLSESEEIFGMHPIYDAVTILNLCGFALDIAGIVFGTSFFTVGTVRKCIGKIGKVVVRVLSVGEAVVKNELASYTASSIIESAFDKTDLAWANNFVSLYDDLTEIADGIIAEPNYYHEILNYCAHDTNYLIYMELKNGVKYKIEDICKAINN